MKKIKCIPAFFAVAVVLSLASCEDEIVRESTHTDASAMVAGTYTGTLSLDTATTFSDVTVIITKIEADSVQAVTINVKAANFNYTGALGMDVYANLNVAKANDDYEFSSGFASTLRLIGRLRNNDLYMKLPIQVRSSNKEVRFHTNGIDWVFNGTKI
ncbi:MAG: hypothetical protein U0T82_16895 [Bacteroidales bacterium]